METKIKLAKLESKDRTYLLKGSGTPLTYFLPSRDTPRRRLLHFDEETNTNHPLRYARNSNTPFQENQDQNVILEPVVFEDGVEVTRTAPPSIWAFQNNAISDLETALKNVNKSALTSEEKTLLRSWMNGV